MVSLLPTRWASRTVPLTPWREFNGLEDRIRSMFEPTFADPLFTDCHESTLPLLRLSLP